MLSTLTADAAALTSSFAAAPETRRKTMSLQQRIVLTMALLALLMTAIGVLGLTGAWRANRANRDTYENKLVLKQQFMAVAMRQNQPDLLKTVDAFVAKNTANGELNKLYKKWLQSDLPALPAQ